MVAIFTVLDLLPLPQRSQCYAVLARAVAATGVALTVLAVLGFLPDAVPPMTRPP